MQRTKHLTYGKKKSKMVLNTRTKFLLDKLRVNKEKEKFPKHQRYEMRKRCCYIEKLLKYGLEVTQEDIDLSTDFYIHIKELLKDDFLLDYAKKNTSKVKVDGDYIVFNVASIKDKKMRDFIEPFKFKKSDI